MKTKALKLTLFSWVLLFLCSCLTINIYFPEAAVKKTADEIVEDIRKSDEEKKEIKKSVLEENQGISFSFIPSAYAQEETQVTTPKIRALKQSLKARFPKLRPFFDKGNIGEANNGFIRVRDESGLALREKAQLRSLEKEENKDRRNLYTEVAKALDIDSSQINRVQKIFAGSWIKDARPGWWIQKENGQWVKKQ